MSRMSIAGGGAFDLANPSFDGLDWRTHVAGPLSRQVRFNGHAGQYSVAEHCARGAEAALTETSDPVLAAAVLLHDAHEAFLGDLTFPVQRRIERALAVFPHVWRQLCAELDAMLYPAAGLPWPLPKAMAAEVKSYDIRMLATERRQLLAQAPKGLWTREVTEAQPLPLRGKLRCLAPIDAEDLWMYWFNRVAAPVREARRLALPAAEAAR